MNRTGDTIYTPSAPRRNIPTVRTSFIGRKREMTEVARLLGSSRLVTLTGAAGCGKTRLALHATSSAGEQCPDGVTWIELARLADPGLIAKRVAKALHVTEQQGRPLLDSILEALQDKQLLLVLDNCEHLLQGCAELAERLVAESAVSVLATSREPLGVAGEHLFPVTPLSLPPATLTGVREIAKFDATQLFVERARAILSGFELTEENAVVVASICRQLDGIPLAIELASARVNVLTVAQIAARLDRLFELLPAVTPASYSPHKTLRAAIEWSYELLSPPEQLLLQRLSVFPAGCSLNSAETVAAGDGVAQEQVLELLSALVSKSLLVAKTLQRTEAHYSMLATIRQYGQERLLASGERAAVYDRYLQWYMQVAEETAPKVRGQYQQLWLIWLEGEYDNIRTALSWSLNSEATALSLQGNRIEMGLRIANALYHFWMIRDYAEEGFVWYERLLAEADENVPAAQRAMALTYASFMSGFRGNSAEQIAYGRKAGALAETLDEEDKLARAWALAARAYGARAEGDFQTEFTTGKRVIELYREVGETYFAAVSLSTYSYAAMSAGEYEEARKMLDEALPLLRDIGEPYRIAMAFNFSGDLARCEQNYVQAQAAYEESVHRLRELDAPRDLASALHNLGHTYLHLGAVERAYDLLSESMALQQAHQNTAGVAECLLGFAALAIVSDLPVAGTRLLAAATAIGGKRTASMWAATRMEYEYYMAQARECLTETAFQVEEAAGRAFSLEQAVAYAREAALRALAAEESKGKLDELTEREREVTALIAHARSNDEIAEELVLSKRTVEKHISNIRSKLGLTQRAQIVRWAIETGLVEPDK